jgi:phospholipid/cholesterol/gamma-HCH transport system substrate-binding protein
LKKYAMESSVGIFDMIGLMCVGYLTVQPGHVPLLKGDTYRLNARFTSVSGLKVRSAVNMFGI